MASEPSGTNALLPGGLTYNKAHKHYLKSIRHRQTGSSAQWTPFRASEKKYMAKFPPPDLSDVLDLALLDEERRDEVDNGIWKGAADALEVRELPLKGNADAIRRRAFCVPQVPGLVILPGCLSHETQRRLIRWCLAEHARQPNETNLDSRYEVPGEGLWNLHIRSDARLISPRKSDPAAVLSQPPQLPEFICDSNRRITHDNGTSRRIETLPIGQTPATASDLILKLRWANIGWFYNWGTKQYEFDRGKVEVGEPVRSICKEIVSSIDWRGVFDGELATCGVHLDWDETCPDWDSWDSIYEPDAGIVNFYQYKDTLMGHVDRAEVCATSPLVSLSLGNAAVFLIGSLTKNETPLGILLRSGDAVVMAGPGCRRAYHGIPRILEGTMPAHLDAAAAADPGSDWTPYGRYLRTARINVNVRQVFPKGFDPSQCLHTCPGENDGRASQSNHTLSLPRCREQ